MQTGQVRFRTMSPDLDPFTKDGSGSGMEPPTWFWVPFRIDNKGVEFGSGSASNSAYKPVPQPFFGVSLLRSHGYTGTMTIQS